MSHNASPSVFNCEAFRLRNLTEGPDILAFIDYLRDDLQVYLYEGFQFASHTAPEVQNGRHVFTSAEAAQGERLLSQARRLLGGQDSFDDAYNERDIFNTDRFSHRHITTVEQVCDLAQYIKYDLRYSPVASSLGHSSLDYSDLWAVRNTLCAAHRFTTIEVALLARLLSEAEAVCEGTEYDFQSIIDDVHYDALEMPGEIARVRRALRSGSLEQMMRELEEYDRMSERCNFNELQCRFGFEWK